MKKITRKKHLEMRLQSVPTHPKPKVGLEQYTTPSSIASDLIWNAFSMGDIDGKNILDLGCGYGAIGIIERRAVERVAHDLSPVLPPRVEVVVVVDVHACNVVGNLSCTIVIDRTALVLGVDILEGQGVKPAAAFQP